MQNPKSKQCAIYTRKSSENGLEQSFNSLHAQREACEAYVKSQAHEGWVLRPTEYDDGGISGGHMERPALHQLIEDIKINLVNVVVVYKVDRLSRSLADFVQLVRLFDEHEVSFVSITQHFNTSSSMGRLTLNVLLSFAQFEREVTSERIRDKIAASKRKGMWMGGSVPLGYDVNERRLIISESEAETVRHIYARYLILGCVRKLKRELDTQGYVSKLHRNGRGGKQFSRGALYTLLRNPLYVGRVKHKNHVFDGQHASIVNDEIWSAVQNLLNTNKAISSKRSKAKAPSLLAGLLFDDRGNRMSPTHTTKGKRRYRYYVNQALVKFEGGNAASIKRVPANEIEEQVLEQIKTFLNQPDQLLQTYDLGQASIPHKRALIDSALKLTELFNTSDQPKLIEVLNRLVDKVEISDRELKIHVRLNELHIVLSPSGDTGIQVEQSPQTIVLHSPTELKRCGIECRLIIGNRTQLNSHPGSVEAIQKAVAKALEWSDALLSGKARTVTELAEKEGLSQRYLSSLIHLSLLAPDIIERVADGQIPPGLSLGKLTKDFPWDWADQRRQFGFSL
jgi:DNA invertase Pin-like site-specific DNA recombinase